MIFSVTRNGRELRFSETLPTQLLPYKVFPICFTSRGKWGTILFQVMITPEFTLWYNRYQIKEESRFMIRAAVKTIELHFATHNKLSFDTRGLGNTKLYEGQFNLIYLPEVDTTGYFAPGEYESFGISFSKDYMNRFEPHLPGLKQFLDYTDGQEPVRFHTGPQYASAAMMSVIKGLLDYNYNKGLSSIYLECKVLELLTLAVDKMEQEKTKQVLMPPDENFFFENIKAWLMDHVDYSGSLAALAAQFYINEYKLKKGFKLLYDTTIFDFLLKLRMERAKKMLEETKLSVTEIGYHAGYSTVAHFSDGFRKYFGFSPKVIRKR